MRILPLAAASALALTCLGASTVAGAASNEGPILPGYWESTSKVTFPLPSSKTERKCISSAAINSYFSGPSNPHYTCRYDTRRVADGHAHMEGLCVDNNGFKSKIKVDGDYTSESFDLDGKVQVMIGGLSIPVDATIQAHRISGECPAGMKVEGLPKKKSDDEG